MNKSDCTGCYNDFYNHRTNCDGKSECWLFKNAKIITRYKIHKDTPQDKPSRFFKVEKPNCYLQQDFSFYNELPSHLKEN